MKKLYLIVYTALILTGCTADHSEHAGHSGGAKSNNSQKTTYRAVGTVEKVDLEKQTATVKHENIKGYMDAMTMDFAVWDKAALASLKSGDKIEFWLEVGELPTIIEFKKLP